MSPSSHQLSPSASLTAEHQAEWPHLCSQISSFLIPPPQTLALPLNITCFITVIRGRLTTAPDSGGEGSKDTEREAERDGGRKRALRFDLRFPAGPELSEALIGSCNSALIWLGQSMRCRLASCDCVAIRPDVKSSFCSWKHTTRAEPPLQDLLRTEMLTVKNRRAARHQFAAGLKVCVPLKFIPSCKAQFEYTAAETVFSCSSQTEPTASSAVFWFQRSFRDKNPTDTSV